jgi:hypothetical protein
LRERSLGFDGQISTVYQEQGMSLTRFAIFILGALPTVAMAAPKELVGKSIVVTWTEERMVRRPGTEPFRSQVRHAEFSVYVSSLGRVFDRLKMTNPRGESGFVDEIGGKTSFSGNSLVAVQTQERGARRIAVTFDQAYSGCTAEVIHAKEAGASTMLGAAIISGRNKPRAEIESSHVSGAISCAIKDGNVFGE